MTREQIIHTFGPVQKVAEVGVLRGKFAAHLRKLNPNELHLIDPWITWDKNVLYGYGKKDQESWNRTYQAVVKKFGGDAVVQIHRMLSVEAAKKFPDGYFDLVYIDANHAYDYVKADIAAWLPKVKRGGIIGGHDYNEEPVKRAVGELLSPVIETDETKQPTKIKYPDSWFYRKP